MSEHCPITEEQVGCLVDGELTGQEQRRVAAHVSVCEHCSALAGRILAGKRFLSASSPEVDPPAGSWDRLVVALDDTDSLARAMQPQKTRSLDWRSVPALAACGLLLIVSALVWRSQSSEAAGMGPIFVRQHLAAEASFSRAASTAGNVYDVVTSRPGNPTWVPIARRLFPMGGKFVDHTLYRVDDRAKISEFQFPADLFDRSGLGAVSYGSAQYWVRAERGGSVVAWETSGLMHVLVARTDATDLLGLAAHHRSHSTTGPAL
ncbi:MAG: zf-HC2 domain-containing protein [Armatimonadetes bacterium]|jgi:hypothetical protein|nr:zf-HC2 domain-containing protein [Armatimonadota bacterium]